MSCCLDGLCLQDEQMAWAAAYKARPPSEAIVFIVGGSTYEEAKAVAEWNAKQGSSGGGGGGGAPGPGGLGGTPAMPMRTILGGSCVLNSSMMLSALGAGAGGGGGGAGDDMR
jgi:vacuolar protein sorting-associated protein 45